MIRKQAVKNSLNQNFVQQSQFLYVSGEYIPDAREVIFSMITYYLKTKQRLFRDYFVRTNYYFGIKDVVPIKYFIQVGHFRRFIEMQFESMIEHYQNFTDVGLITACYSNLSFI